MLYLEESNIDLCDWQRVALLIKDIMPYQVREHLFIGSIEDAAEVLVHGSDEITHILSILSSASISTFSGWRSELSIPTKEIRKEYVDADDTKSSKLFYLLEYAGKDLKVVRMATPLRDMENENLLNSLDVCLDFIEESRKEGSILVHCFAGVSRSASILAAYLMKTEQLSQEEAIGSLRQSCEFICPNDGFLDQLKMFEEMGFKVDHDSPVYKRFHLKVLGDCYNRGERINSSKFGADPGLAREKISMETSVGRTFRCKKCRRVVAVQGNIVDHVPGVGETAFGWHKRRGGNPLDKREFECSSVFVEPLRWMRTVAEGGLEGKLSCALCEARLGYFNWSGIQCSCGSWIAPAFQLHKSRVDITM